MSLLMQFFQNCSSAEKCCTALWLYIPSICLWIFYEGCSITKKFQYMSPMKFPTKHIFRIFWILKIDTMTSFCNLFMEWPSCCHSLCVSECFLLWCGAEACASLQHNVQWPASLSKIRGATGYCWSCAEIYCSAVARAASRSKCCSSLSEVNTILSPYCG